MGSWISTPTPYGEPLRWPVFSTLSRCGPLPRIRSLAYFQPVIEELHEHPVLDGYLDYLRLKLRATTDKNI
jgi:hypothetical protein